jgi:hypothetical protein
MSNNDGWRKMNENKTGAGGRRRVSYIINKLLFLSIKKLDG